MIFEQISVGTMNNFVYLLGDEISREAILVDAGFEPQKIITVLRKHNLRLTQILLTHFHYDHSSCAEELSQLTGARILASEKGIWKRNENPERGYWVIPSSFDFIDEETEIFLGPIPGKVLETPGHQNDHLCFCFDKFLFTGDLLFVGNVGRTDLPDSDPVKMKKSLEKISILSDDFVVCPGHDYGEISMRTLGEERHKNPSFSGFYLESKY